MLKNKKSLILIFLSLLMAALVGCSKNEPTKTPNSDTTMPKTEKAAMSKEDYQTYLSERYNYYFNDSKLYNDYNIYQTDFNYDGTYDEFVTGYNSSYTDLKTNLESFKNDLKTNVNKGTAEVDKLNNDVITSIDKSILAIDDYTSGFATKAKDFGTLTKDEAMKGLRDIGRMPHDARMELDRLINDAKNTLGIQ